MSAQRSTDDMSVAMCHSNNLNPDNFMLVRAQ